MGQILYTINIFFINSATPHRTWQNCNAGGLARLERNHSRFGIAYVAAFQQHTKNVCPLFTRYFESVYICTCFYSDGRPPRKDYNVTNFHWYKINAQRDGAAGINAYDMKERKHETIKF